MFFILIVYNPIGNEMSIDIIKKAMDCFQSTSLHDRYIAKTSNWVFILEARDSIYCIVLSVLILVSSSICCKKLDEIHNCDPLLLTLNLV